MAGNRVAANLLMLLFLVGGFYSAKHVIQKEFFPNIEADIIRVTIPYPGSSPEEVERGVTLAVEEAVRGIEQVKEVRSTSSEGSSQVTVELLEGSDKQKAARDVQNALDRITTFPEDIEQPRAVIASRKREVLKVYLYGDMSENVLLEQAEELQDMLIQSPDVTQLDIIKSRNPELTVEVTLDQLRAHGLTLIDISQAIRVTSIERPGGGIKTPSGEILLRVAERRESAEELMDIPLKTLAGGRQLTLGEIATLRDGFEDVDSMQTVNGKRAIGLAIYRVGKESPTQVSDGVHRVLKEFEQRLPEGAGTLVWDDRSESYQGRMDLMIKNLTVGLALVLVGLGIFLSPKLAFWVTMGIPISFLGAFLVLPLLGTSLNMVSMFAFIISLGIVVDDAVVVGENIFEKRKQGLDRYRAAVEGVGEVVTPVCFSILTNVIAFIPLTMAGGTTGKIFSIIPMVVCTVFIISLVESLFILPAHLTHGDDEPQKKSWLINKQQAISEGLDSFIEKVFRPLLETSVANRYLSLSIALSILIITMGFVGSGRMGFSPFPHTESDQAVANFRLPFGTPVEKTIEVRSHIEKAAQKVIEANGGDTLSRGIHSNINGSSSLSVRIALTPGGVRPIETKEFTQLWREAATPLPSGLEFSTFSSSTGGPSSGSALTLELSHPDVLQLEEASVSLGKALLEYDGVRDVDNGVSPGKEQLDIRVNDLGRSLGLTSAGLSRQLRAAYFGEEAQRLQKGRNEVKVRIRLSKEERSSQYELENTLVTTPAGKHVPLMEVAHVDRGNAYTRILRKDGRRSIEVRAQLLDPSKAGQVTEGVFQDFMPILQQDYPGLIYRVAGRQQQMRENLAGLKTGFIGAMILIYAVLAVPFRSYTQPFIILMAVPFGLVGAVIGHVVMGYSLSIISMMGLIALSGVVVNDALVLIDYANRLHKGGMHHREAIIRAGVRRFRPILLTTITTFAGLAPMILETSRQARFLIPMALSLGFGIIFATAITLLIIPCLFMAVEDIKSFFFTDSVDEQADQSKEKLSNL